jgi:hypothetical protein
LLVSGISCTKTVTQVVYVTPTPTYKPISTLKPTPTPAPKRVYTNLSPAQVFKLVTDYEGYTRVQQEAHMDELRGQWASWQGEVEDVISSEGVYLVIVWPDYPQLFFNSIVGVIVNPKWNDTAMQLKKNQIISFAGQMDFRVNPYPDSNVIYLYNSEITSVH